MASRTSCKQEILMFAVGEWFFFIFLYRNVALYYVSHDFGRSVRYSETKKQGKCRAGGHESVRISVIARVRDDGVYFSHFFMRFAGEAGFCPLWRSVRNSKVSARRHPTVFRNLKETYRSSYRENMLAWRIEWRQASAHTEVLEINKKKLMRDK